MSNKLVEVRKIIQRQVRTPDMARALSFLDEAIADLSQPAPPQPAPAPAPEPKPVPIPTAVPVFDKFRKEPKQTAKQEEKKD